jgi:hypothetical protein
MDHYSEDIMTLKVSFNNHMRRLCVPRDVSMSALRDRVSALFKIESNDEAWYFKYLDHDGDVVTMTEDYELREATMTHPTLKLNVVMEGESDLYHSPVHVSVVGDVDGKIRVGKSQLGKVQLSEARLGKIQFNLNKDQHNKIQISHGKVQPNKIQLSKAQPILDKDGPNDKIQYNKIQHDRLQFSLDKIQHPSHDRVQQVSLDKIQASKIQLNKLQYCKPQLTSNITNVSTICVC